MKHLSKRSLSRTISLKFVGIIFLSNIMFITATFFLLRHQLADKDQNIANARFHEIETVLEASGVETLRKLTEEGQFNKLEDLLIEIHDEKGLKIFERMPQRMENFDLQIIQSHLEQAKNIQGALTIYPEEIFEETIETYSGRVGSYQLTVGINTDASEDFLNLYFRMALIATTVSGIISVLLGYYFTKKSLKPIRNLISTVKLVQAGEWKTIHMLESSRDELSELTRLFNDMIVQIQKLIFSLQGSLDAIAHDLRTPLTHMTNKLENLLKEEVVLNKDSIGYLMEEVQGLSALVNTLLEITEADSKSLVLKKDIFPVVGVIKECVELYEYISEERQATVLVRCNPDIQIIADRNKLKRVVANLLDNALKYSFEKPVITIECSMRDHDILLFIEDEGIGVSELDKNRIWQRLYRGDVSRTTKGMGLGLSFVKSIVDAHGWEITLESGKNGKGARFVIRIPKVSEYPAESGPIF